MANKFYGGILAGSTDVSIPVELRSTGTSIEKTAVAHGSVTAYYWRQGAVTVVFPTAMNALATASAAHSDSGWVQVNATGNPGIYRLDVPDAAFATGADWVVISVVVSGAFTFSEKFSLSTDVIQTGDSFARIGASGASLTSLASATNLATANATIAKLETTVEIDGGVYRFNANALEMAPIGGGGAAPTVAAIRAEMDNNSTKLALIDAAITTRQASFSVPESFATANFALLTNLDATVGSRLATASFTQRGEPPTVGAIADAVCDEALSGHTTLGTLGATLTSTATITDVAPAYLTLAFQALNNTLADGDNAIQIVTEALSTMIEEDGAVYRFTTNALEQSPALTGGSGTATLENQQAILAALTTANVIVTSPVTVDGGIIRIVEGDSYYTTDGRQLDFTSTDWPVLTGGSFSFKCEALTVGCAVTAAQTLRLQLTEANTTALSVGKHTFHLDGTLANGHHVTLKIGSVFVAENK